MTTYETTLSVSQARMIIEALNEEQYDDFTDALDNAQGQVHSGQDTSSQLIITISGE